MKIKTTLRRIAVRCGVFVLAGFGMLAPNAAMADDPVTVDPSDVKILKKLVTSGVGFSGEQFPFEIELEPCTEDGCVAAVDRYPDYPGSSPGGNFYTRLVFVSASTVGESISFLPEADRYTEAGVYAWKITESDQRDTQYQRYYKKSKAEYYVRAAVKKVDGGFAYSWVTITKNKNDDGTPNGSKVNNLYFVNVDESTGYLDVVKNVVNDVGLTELDTYNMKVQIHWPFNFDGEVSNATGKWTVTVPDVKAADDTEATGTVCTADMSVKATVCTFSLAKGKKARFEGIPVGSHYVVEETSRGKFTASYENESGVIPVGWKTTVSTSNVEKTEAECSGGTGFGLPGHMVYTVYEWDSGSAQCVAKNSHVIGFGSEEEQKLVTVSNTYEDIPATGIILEYMPYVLMVVIPLAAIAGYIALKRRMIRA